MVCVLDGHIYRTHVLLPCEEVLSANQRQRLLNQIIPGQTGMRMGGFVTSHQQFTNDLTAELRRMTC